MHSKFLNIVFWGEDSFSDVVLKSLVREGCRVRLVISPLYDNSIYKRLENTCRKFDITFRRYPNVNSDEVVEQVKTVSPDLCVIAHFEKILKPPLLEIPRLGFINLHPSLLPDYRGLAPQHWPIINGESKTGVTVHYVDSGIDTGDIILQEHIEISQDMYVSDLQKRWIGIYNHIVIDAIQRILNHSPVIPQPAETGRYYGKLKEEQCRFKLTDNCSYVYNLIRGVSMPYHGAEINNILLWKVHYPDAVTQSRIMGNYTTNGIYRNTEYGDFLRLSDGVLLIDKYQLKDGKDDNCHFE